MWVVLFPYTKTFPPGSPTQHASLTPNLPGFCKSPSHFCLVPYQRICLARSLQTSRPAVVPSLEVRSVKSHWPCWAEDAASRGVLSPQVQSLITRPLDPDPGIHLANTDTGNSVAAPIRMVAGRILSRRLYETYLAQGLFTDDNA